jgi:hypothetical protein
MSLVDCTRTRFVLVRSIFSVIAPFAKRGGSGKADHFSGAFHIYESGFKHLL